MVADDGVLPCVVLGLETQIGLNIVRELGRAGVRVIGVAQSPHAMGLRSRYLWKGLVEPRLRSPELLALLQDLGRKHGACPLIAISEANLLWLQQQREALAPLKPAVPDAQALATVLDKRATLAAAAAVGLEVPRTWQPLSADDALSGIASFPLPAVLKWSDPNGVTRALAEAGLDLLKSEYVTTAKELADALGRYDRLGQWPIVQQYCPGYGLGQFFFMHRGRALRRFQHRRVCEWPPEGGASCVADAVPLSEHAELQSRSEALLLHIGWEGVAMVEFRHDPRSGKSWLMEINGRFWGSFPLSVSCGAGFARLAHAAASGLALPRLPPPRDDLRSRMLGNELKRLVRVLLQPGKIPDRNFVRRPWAETARFLGDFLNPRCRYYVADLDDPMPLLVDMVNLLLRR
jgi:predicted ATP-grasp superfamily ATP-dependent carboligase